jgi:AraC family L-rhamnose operon transcriptional activator RhaR
MSARFTDLRALTLGVTLGGYAAHIRGWGYYEPKWWRNYLHEHSFFEICYAYAGRGTFLINGVLYTVRAGEVFVAKPGEPHEIVSSEDDPLGIYFWSYTLTPSHSTGDDANLTALLDAFVESRRWVDDAPTMQATLAMLTDEIVRREAGYAEVIRGLVAKLLVETARAVTDTPLPDAPHDAHDPVETVVRDVVRYLRDNYSRPLRIRDVAAQVHLSERHVQRVFREVMGVSIKDYLTEYRLGVAKQLLLNGQMSIGEVAYASGYGDVRHFITLFRQRTGLTPAVYRQSGGTVFLGRDG